MIELWYQALHSAVGIEIVCSDPPRVAAKLRQIRKEVQDPDLDSISICSSPFDPTKLWMVKKRIPDAT